MAKSTTPKPFYKKVWFQAIVAVILLIVFFSAISGSNEEATDNAGNTPTTTEETTPETTTEQTPATPDAGAEEWFDEAIYRANNCASQSIAYGGVALCEIRGTDLANDNTMLVGYVDQDRDGTQEHFENEQRRDMFVQSFADRVLSDKLAGDPRLEHIADVRVIASGGEGMFSGWQGETALQ